MLVEIGVKFKIKMKEEKMMKMKKEVGNQIEEIKIK